MEDQPVIERLRVLRLEEGDALAVNIGQDVHMTMEMADTLKQQIRAAIGDHPIVLIQGDVELTAVRP